MLNLVNLKIGEFCNIFTRKSRMLHFEGKLTVRLNI